MRQREIRAKINDIMEDNFAHSVAAVVSQRAFNTVSWPVTFQVLTLVKSEVHNGLEEMFDGY